MILASPAFLIVKTIAYVKIRKFFSCIVLNVFFISSVVIKIEGPIIFFIKRNYKMGARKPGVLTLG
jgi:hypothetical protein